MSKQAYAAGIKLQQSLVNQRLFLPKHTSEMDDNQMTKWNLQTMYTFNTHGMYSMYTQVVFNPFFLNHQVTTQIFLFHL